jgi:hypothetical protein
MPALSMARPPPEEASAFFANGCDQNAVPASFFAKYTGLGFSAHRRPGSPCLVYAGRLWFGFHEVFRTLARIRCLMCFSRLLLTGDFVYD